MLETAAAEIAVDAPEAYVNRELSWLAFARRVLSLVEDREVPLLERVKFAGIMGMLHDEFFMKRMSGLKRQIARGVEKRSLDGLRPQEEFQACRAEIVRQARDLDRAVQDELRPGLARAGIPILDYGELSAPQRGEVDAYFRSMVLPILTPLAVDAEHPFPFISNLGLNLGVELHEGRRDRFVRIKVPANRARWVPLSGVGFVPLEQVIAANLRELFPVDGELKARFFRVTRGAEGEAGPARPEDEADSRLMPGSIISQVTDELKARRFAGPVRLQVAPETPERLCAWLARQVGTSGDDLYVTESFLGMADLLSFRVEGHDELRDPAHEPATHPRLRGVTGSRIFDEIRHGDILLHHPYHSFDASILRFLDAAAVDPAVLGLKLTIYRTSSGSPIVRALAEAARRGKQVAVLVEITARFDEAPNIAWGRYLENEGAHVAYGVERLKTHVKLAMVVREERDGLRRYVHIGTGNYHTGTARLYEDLGLLTCDPDLANDVAAVFNELTGATPHGEYRKLLVAPAAMRDRFAALIRREAEHARAGRPARIRAKMNQLQDPPIIRELYRASQAGVRIDLNVRGLCCLRAGVPGLSESIRVTSVVGRFLEHGRIYIFENGGRREYYTGSADWMKRNLDNRVETITPVEDPGLCRELEAIWSVYEEDNASGWDLQPDGTYVRRGPAAGEPPRRAQERFISQAR